MTKKIIALILVSLMTFSLAACGGDNDSVSSNLSTQQVVSELETSSKEETAETSKNEETNSSQQTQSTQQSSVTQTTQSVNKTSDKMGKFANGMPGLF